MPEKANSVLWVRDGKDALALGNITGAMTFQASIPVALGLVFTDWELDAQAVAAAVIGLLGGALALWAIRAGTGVSCRSRCGAPCSSASWPTRPRPASARSVLLGRPARPRVERRPPAPAPPARVRAVDAPRPPLSTASRSAAGNRPGSPEAGADEPR